jgi:hypothetical protein
LQNLFKDLKPLSILSMATFMDKLFFVFLVIFAIASFFFAKGLFPSGTLVKISLDNKTVYTLSLQEDSSATVRGSLGENLIEIKNGKVHMKDAPCPDKICIKQGWIDRGAIVCLPNKVVVTVGGGEEHLEGLGYDAVTK